MTGLRYNEGKRKWGLLSFLALDEFVRVLEYGQQKYAKRGDCTCHGGVRHRPSLVGASLETTTKKNLEKDPLTLRKDKEKTEGTGTNKTQKNLENTKSFDAKDYPKIQITNYGKSTSRSISYTDYLNENTTNSFLPGVAFADQLSDPAWITVIPQEKPGEYYAIPATLALDLSNGLTIGLSEHSPTCGIHKISSDGSWNWAKGLSFTETFESLMRHALAWYNGEDRDPETGCLHVAHVGVNAMFLCHFILTGTGRDDRQPKVELSTRKTISDKELYRYSCGPRCDGCASPCNRYSAGRDRGAS